jgi:hypothetical protein
MMNGVYIGNQAPSSQSPTLGVGVKFSATHDGARHEFEAVEQANMGDGWWCRKVMDPSRGVLRATVFYTGDMTDFVREEINGVPGPWSWGTGAWVTGRVLSADEMKRITP